MNGRTRAEHWSRRIKTRFCPASYLLPKEVHFMLSCVKRTARAIRSKQEVSEPRRRDTESKSRKTWGGLYRWSHTYTSCLSLPLGPRPWGFHRSPQNQGQNYFKRSHKPPQSSDCSGNDLNILKHPFLKYVRKRDDPIQPRFWFLWVYLSLLRMTSCV